MTSFTATWMRRSALVCAALLACLAAHSTSVLAQTTLRVSVDSNGNQCPGGVFGFLNSVQPTISDDGRFVAFEATAQCLVPNDTNGVRDIFVHDLHTSTTTRVSVSSSGVQANSNCFGAAISADGRFVAFHSAADSLVPGDFNGNADIFVHDRITGITERVSVATDGTQGEPGPFSGSQAASLSADGRFVAFKSGASNLVPGDTNGVVDIFVRDRLNGTTERVSITSGGAEANNDTSGDANGRGGSHFPSISGDGRYVVFESTASNLVPGDTNATWDVFLHDRQSSTTTRVSVASNGTQGNGESRWPRISTDGSTVTFSSRASNLVPGDTNGVWDVFVYDIATATMQRVSVATDGTQGDRSSNISRVSATGRYITFNTDATTFDPADTDNFLHVYLHDRQTGVTERVSLTFNGFQQPNNSSRDSAVSADGRFIAFESSASNLVLGDTNAAVDVFVRDRGQPPCAVDWNQDGIVNSSDISAYITSWLADVANGTTLADFDGSGGTNSSDISAFLTAWLAAVQGGC